MAVFYFKSPDYDLSGNYKVEIVSYNQDIADVGTQDETGEISWGELTIHIIDIKINDGASITLFTDMRDGMIPSHDIFIGKETKITIDITNDLDILCSLRELQDIVQIDRVVDSYWSDTDFLKVSLEQYNEAQDEYAEIIKDRFKADLMTLLKRYNQKDIGRKGTLTERIQRLFKRHYGHTIPPFKISDLGGV